MQKGIHQLLIGMYQAIRNPRAHEKYIDSRDDMEAIVLFLGYLVRIIDQSKSPFEKSEYLNQVFDPFFVDNKKYADLLVQKIPHGKRFEILVAVYNRKEQGSPNTLRLFFSSLIEALSPEDLDNFCEIISEELNTTYSEATIRTVLDVVPTTVDATLRFGLCSST